MTTRILWSVAVRVTDAAGEHPDVVLDVCLRADTKDEATRLAPELARARVRAVRQIPRRRPFWSADSIDTPLADDRRLRATALHASSIDEIIVCHEAEPNPAQEAMFS